MAWVGTKFLEARRADKVFREYWTSRKVLANSPTHPTPSPALVKGLKKSLHCHWYGTTLLHGSFSFFLALSIYRSVLNATEDETFEIGTPKVGESKNYPEDFEWEWFLIVPEGRQVELTFEIFELEQSTDCENDYLEVREALFQFPFLPFIRLDGRYGSILSKPVCGTNKPGTIRSVGNMVWVHFKSDRNATTTYRGFKASFKAGVYMNISNYKALVM